MCNSYKYLLFALIATISFATQAAPHTPSMLPQEVYNQTRCSEFFNAIINQYTKDHELIWDIQYTSQNSGHNLNDMGYYENCVSNSSYHFVLLEVGLVGKPGNGYIGVCSPWYCSADAWTTEATTLQNNIANFGGGPFILNFTMNFTDPFDLGLSNDGGSYVIFIWLAVIVIGGMALTVWGQCTTVKSGQSLGSPGSYISQPMNVLNNASGMSSLTEGRDIVEKDSNSNRPSFLKVLLSCYDISRNWNELTGKTEKADQDKTLRIWNGIRAISIAYITFGHAFLLSNSSKNLAAAAVFAQESWWFLIAFAAVYAVDVFFFLSGFFATYTLIEKLKQTTGVVDLVKIYLYRFARLWPVYMVVLFFFWKVVPFFTTGPVWWQLVDFTNACNTSWWQNLLFVDNITNTPNTEHCMIWAFYIAADFQMFILTPLIILFYLKLPRYGKMLLLALILGSSGASYGFAVDANLPYQIVFNPIPNVNDIFNIFFFNPIVHWASYLIGIYVAILYKNYKNGEQNIYYKAQQNFRYAITLALSGLVLILFAIFFPRTEQQYIITFPEGVAYSWMSFGRPFITYSVWLIMLPILTGHLKSCANFLRWGIFNLASNLIYCYYLIHFIIILYIYSSDTQFQEFSLAKKIYTTLTVLMMGFTFAVGFHLFVEKPITLLAKTYLAPRNTRIYLREMSDSSSSAAAAKAN